MSDSDLLARASIPDIDLRQLSNLTDDTGMLQHAAFSAPNRDHGYCTDDNARALIAGVLHARLRGGDDKSVPIQCYLSFLSHAFNVETGRFRNFMSYDRRWLEEAGSEDSHGRSIWALGVAVAMAPNETIKGLSERLFEPALRVVESFPHLRSRAFALMGLNAYLAQGAPPHAIAGLRARLAGKLFEAWRTHASDDWPWWEDTVTYDNAKLPHALIASGAALNDAEMLQAGLTSLEWLLRVQTAEQGHLDIIGNRGWMVRGGQRARFDQQPLEAHALLHACLAAATVTGEERWVHQALNSFSWFQGRNALGVPIHDEESGGCRDGLGEREVNPNQGAESSLAFLLSVLELHLYRQTRAGAAIGPAKSGGLGVVGASKFAAFCMEQYREIEGLRPVAVWNRTAAKGKEFGQRYGLRHTEHLDALLDDADVSFVHVASTPAHHAAHALAAMERGKHVLCEKPLATTVDDADRMLRAAREKGVRLMPNFVMRYGPLWEPLKALIEDGALGILLRGDLINCAGDNGLPPEHWFWDETEAGGIFVEHGVHFFDLVRSWLGEGRVVGAHRVRRPGSGHIDQVCADVLYGDHTSFGFYHGFHQPPQMERQELRLFFERGRVVMRGWLAQRVDLRALLSDAQAGRLAEIFRGAEITSLQRFEGRVKPTIRRDLTEPVDVEIRLRWSDGLEKQAAYGKAIQALMEDFLLGVRASRHRTRVGAEDGRAALALALQADRMAREVTP